MEKIEFAFKEIYEEELYSYKVNDLIRDFIEKDITEEEKLLNIKAQFKLAFKDKDYFETIMAYIGEQLLDTQRKLDMINQDIEKLNKEYLLHIKTTT